MNDGFGYDRRRAWFFWGMVLVGTSSIPFLVMFFNVFRGMAREKATGLTAVAGGLTEAYVTFGLHPDSRPPGCSNCPACPITFRSKSDA